MRKYDPYNGMIKNIGDTSNIPVVTRYPTMDELVGRFKMSEEDARIVVERQVRTTRRSGTRTAGS